MAPDTDKSAGAWSNRLSEPDRRLVDAVNDWLAPIEWQFFVTLEFTWDVRSETAHSTLKEYLRRIGEQIREPVCFIAGMENESKATGMRVPWHFHLLMTAHRPIPMDLLKQIWWNMVGRGAKTLLHPEGSSVVLEQVDPERAGLEYCLKFANHCCGDWVWRWLEIFNPNIPRSADQREVRRRKRAERSRLSVAKPFNPTR
jgi:hypothetical protein